jgi:S-adenosylmethionine synthetase
MIRICEMVLPGHPDKFSDQIADAIVAECLRVDPDAYCQVEVGVWSDQAMALRRHLHARAAGPLARRHRG